MAISGEMIKLLDTIREAGPELSANGQRHDRDGSDPADNFALLAGLGAGRLLIPAEYGGLWEGGPLGGLAALIRAAVTVTAGDGATGQCWGTDGLVCRQIFGAPDALPETTRAEIARRVLHEGLRLVASNAQTGTTGPVTVTPATGGVVLNGTKTFNTNSGGRGLASVGCVRPDGSRQVLLVELDRPEVELHDDWDNMGQRGTRSQSITYHDVFVADGWHFVAGPPTPQFAAFALLTGAALMQGVGDGALAATAAYLRTMKRGSLPQFATPAEDPLILRRVGATSSRLAASRALLFATADAFESGDAGDDATVGGFQARVACAEAALDAAAAIHEVTGARSTANTFGLDRFWRNARTFASHDPTDAKNVYIGGYELTGELPSLATVLNR